MRVWLPFALVVLAVSSASPARAQCTTCSPLSLPSGALVGQDFGAARRATWAVSSQLTSGWIGFPEQVFDNKAIQTRESARFDLFLTTAQATALHKSGAGVGVVLPFGVLTSRTGDVRTQDASLGDVEVRPRFTGLVDRSVRLTANAGAALPTGGYTTRSGSGALGDSARTLTVGRGVVWGLGEFEARWEPTRGLALTSTTEGRLPVGEAPDGFRWGPELRSLLEAEVRPFGPAFGFALGGEVQARAAGSIVDPFLNTRLRSDNVRATILSAVPGVRAQLESGWFFSVSGRVPVVQDQEGLQFRQGPGVFAGLGLVVPIAPSASSSLEKPPETPGAASASAHRFIVREYGATWCEPCQRLAPILEAKGRERPDVRVERIDITPWSDAELAERVPDVKALPIVLVLRRDGSLVRRLEGEDAFRFAEYLVEDPR